MWFVCAKHDTYIVYCAKKHFGNLINDRWGDDIYKSNINKYFKKIIITHIFIIYFCCAIGYSFSNWADTDFPNTIKFTLHVL